MCELETAMCDVRIAILRLIQHIANRKSQISNLKSPGEAAGHLLLHLAGLFSGNGVKVLG